MPYCVYEHVFPDGKRYIGLSKDIKSRWGNNGLCYANNRKMMKAIEKYGWDNIKHNIIEDGLTRKEAIKKEAELIKEFDTIENGYNNNGGGAVGATFYGRHVMKMLQACKRAPDCKPYDKLVLFAEQMYDYADDEAWAVQVNLVDYIIRSEVKGYSTEEDPIIEACVWYYYMTHWIAHPDVDIRTIEHPLHIWRFGLLEEVKA